MTRTNYINRFPFLDKIQPGMCPNFYLTGESVSLLEETAVEMAKLIKKKKLINFRGLESYFSILMPYYDSLSSAEQFMNRLLDSYSIARDCYDSYKGIIIVECAKEWSEFGYNSALEVLTSFISLHQEICFILLIPKREGTKNHGSFLGELAKNQLWIKYECKTVCIQDCIELFCSEATSAGYSISEDVKRKLENLLRERSEFLTDNRTTVLHLLKQIQLNKILQSMDNNEILETDLDIMSGLSDKTNKPGIGFNSKIR